LTLFSLGCLTKIITFKLLINITYSCHFNQLLKLMKYLIIFFFAICINGYSQDSLEVKKTEIWNQRFVIGASVGYPQIPFINIGMKFQDKIYFEMFMELEGEINSYSMFIDAGYQANNLFDKNISGQIGLSLLQVPNTNEDNKFNTVGLNMKLTQPITKYFALFLGCHIGLPDKRTTYDNLININLGIEFHLKRIPFLFY
jgi:hypothetical protein